jgi:RNA polymerase sigma factor (sigma-70 family)
VLPLEVDLAGSSASPSNVFRRHERFDRLEAALKSLSPEHQQVLLLVRVEGLTITAAADRLGRTPNAVSLLLLRASRALRAAFGDTASLSLPERELDLGRLEKGDGDAHR